MKTRVLPFFGILALLCACQLTTKEEKNMKNPSVIINTNQGKLEVELFADQAPVTVENFLKYVDEKHFNHTIFHRIIDGFMIQGGGLTAQMEDKPTHGPIQNEASNGLTNKIGTLAMARTSDIHSATSQFFINVSDNDFLNHRNTTSNGFGYCVFGKVTLGMDVVNKIKSVPTHTKNGHQNVPVEKVEIIEIIRK